MNVLEQYIVEVHGEKPLARVDVEEDTTFVLVDVTRNCQGRTDRKEMIMCEKEWEEAKRVGYWRE